ncbi:hypothetical protein HPA02_32210 [Bisbaumannia pacifica]|uniref:Uncharacterized protein n=1 Tax=Bisbaumannia pacifica TaxID=77098 RepID=A0A510XBZ5_9GAMM|nr:hypothetical protein [Halomonas pacifica]GEK48938.1 hypothetical protein HPA02_32210 [Halomonas pacifica]
MNDLWSIKRDLTLSDWTHRDKGGRYRVVEVTTPSGALADMLEEGDLVVTYESTREPWRQLARLLSEWQAKMRRYPQAGDGLAGGERERGGS